MHIIFKIYIYIFKKNNGVNQSAWSVSLDVKFNNYPNGVISKNVNVFLKIFYINFKYVFKLALVLHLDIDTATMIVNINKIIIKPINIIKYIKSE